MLRIHPHQLLRHILSIQEELLLSMMEVVRDSGCEFAAQNQPSQISWTERPRKGLRRVAAA